MLTLNSGSAKTSVSWKYSGGGGELTGIVCILLVEFARYVRLCFYVGRRRAAHCKSGNISVEELKMAICRSSCMIEVLV